MIRRMRRLTVLLALLGAAWFVLSRLRNQVFGNTDTEPANPAGSPSIAEIVRSEPLQASSAPTAAETMTPSEQEAVTPPHGDVLEEELTEETPNTTEPAAQTPSTQEHAEGGADGAANGAQPSTPE